MTWLRSYPVMAALCPVVHLAAANAREWVQLSDLTMPLAVSVAVAVASWLGAALLTRDPDKRAFLAFLAVLGFVAGRIATGAVSSSLPPIGIDPVLASVLLFGLIGLAATVGTVFSRRSFRPASRFLGTMMILLLALVTAHLVSARATTELPRLPAATVPPREGRTGAERRPTVYLIVLDKYQGSSTLRTHYGFDNSGFERALRDRGFVLPARPRVNYTHTRQAMSALLNWEYLDSLVAVVGEENRDLRPLFERIESNRAMEVFKAQGYQIVFFPNRYEPFRRNRNADLQLPDPSAIRPEFESVWIETTSLVPVARVVCRIVRCVHVRGIAEAAELTDWKFERLPALAGEGGPRFVLAHLLVPHEPYVYDADCRHLPPSWMYLDSAATHAAYVNQIRCVNRKVLTAVDAILDQSRIPPVILLQSDHGNGHITDDNLELAAASPAAVRSRMDILAAYHVPEAPDTLFYEGMSPINVLPGVLNHLFGTGYPRLPDRSFWVVDREPYRFTPILEDELAAE